MRGVVVACGVLTLISMGVAVGAEPAPEASVGAVTASSAPAGDEAGRSARCQAELALLCPDAGDRKELRKCLREIRLARQPLPASCRRQKAERARKRVEFARVCSRELSMVCVAGNARERLDCLDAHRPSLSVECTAALDETLRATGRKPTVAVETSTPGEPQVGPTPTGIRPQSPPTKEDDDAEQTHEDE